MSSGPLSPSSTQKYIDKAVHSLSDVPPGKRFALVGVATMNGEWEIRLAWRAADSWQLGAVVSKEPTQEVEGAVWVKATW